MRILITGSTGFAGKYIAKKFLGNNYVLCLVRDKGKFLNSFDKESISQLSFHEIKEPENVTIEDYIQLMEEHNIDTIVHNAAIAREYSIDNDQYYKTNVFWTKNLATAFLRAHTEEKNKFIYISSVGVYGTIPTKTPAKEDTPYNPDGSYHTSKQRAERELTRMKLYQNLPLVILRPSIMYGLGDYGFVYKMFKLTSKGIYPLKNGNYIHLLDLDSFADAIGKFVEMPCNIFENNTRENFIYNISDKQPVEMKTLLEYAKKNVSGNYLQLPSFVFGLLKIIGCFDTALSIKFKLISDTWSYDVSSIQNVTDIKLNDTIDNLEKYKQFYKEAIHGN